jgi:pimeloyl-ACP methyl ester carboxylesterase
MGVPCAAAFGVLRPERVNSLILYWPVGGAKYRLSSHQRFATHIGYLNEHTLADVVALATSSSKSFGEDPRGGPWAAVLRHDRAFADAYARQNLDQYKVIVAAIARTLFDRDTAPGAEPEDLMRLDIPALIVPGRDAAHATSAARYLEECLPQSEYWDVPVSGQTEEATNARVLEFLGKQ